MLSALAGGKGRESDPGLCLGKRKLERSDFQLQSVRKGRERSQVRELSLTKKHGSPYKDSGKFWWLS